MKLTTIALTLLTMTGMTNAQEEAENKPAVPEKNPVVLMKTSMGDITLELFAKEAPKTVQNFLDLAEGKKEFKDLKTGKPAKRPFFDGLIFHRIIDNFMIQGGCPQGSGTGGPGYSFEDEINADALGLDFSVTEALPIAEALLGQIFLDQRRRRRMAGIDDGARGLMGALQMAGDPECARRQLPGQTLEGLAILGIGRHVGLAVEPTLMGGNWGVAHPPPASDRKIVQCVHLMAAKARRNMSSVICCVPPRTSPVWPPI